MNNEQTLILASAMIVSQLYIHRPPPTTADIREREQFKQDLALESIDIATRIVVEVFRLKENKK